MQSRLASISLLAGAFALPAAAQNFQFTDVTDQVGLDYRLAPNGPIVCIGDYDGDGWQDVTISGGSDPRTQLFRNLGAQGGGFVNVSQAVLPENRLPSSMAMFADLENDGDQDLLIVRRHQNAGTGAFNYNRTSLIYFENIPSGATPGGRRYRMPTDVLLDLGFHNKQPAGLALADLDVDSDLDVIFTHTGGSGLNTGSPGFYFRNEGDLRLTDVTSLLCPSLSTPRRYFQPVLADYTGDGLVDLHSAIDLYPDYHCRNIGGGALQDVSILAGTTNGGADMGVAIGDIENDGDWDLFSTNIATGVLYVNDGQGKFKNEALARGVGAWFGPICIGWGTAFVDFDHDMDQDLVCVGKSNPGFFWRNLGDGNFQMVTTPIGLDLYGYSLNPFDYDRDGDIDLLVTDEDGNKTPHLFENRSPGLVGRHWLVVELEGRASNSKGIGAVVRVTAGGVTQSRPIVAGYSYKSGPPVNAHFGLDVHAVADVEVTWPNGTVQTLTGVPVDRYMTVVEP